MMKIEQSLVSYGSVKANPNGLADALVVIVPTSESSTSTTNTFFDSTITENSDATIWNEYIISLPSGSGSTLENLSDTQTLISSRVAPVGVGGFGRLRVMQGSVKKTVKTDTTKRGGGTYLEFVGYENGSVSDYLYNQVAAMFDATPDLNYFSTHNHATSTYTRNSSCWAASIDLSCVAVASNSGSGWTRERGGTLITNRHVIFARHFPLGVGTQLRFSNASGAVETRTIIGIDSASGGDTKIAVLDSNVTIADPCPIAGTWITQGSAVLGSTKTWYSGGLVIHTDQNAKVYAGTVGQTTSLTQSQCHTIQIGAGSFSDCEIAATITHHYGAIPSEFSGFNHTPVAGDSGQPVMLIIGGNPVLFCCWFFSYGGPPTYRKNGAIINALIASADTNAGISTGYTVTVAPDPTA